MPAPTTTWYVSAPGISPSALAIELNRIQSIGGDILQVEFAAPSASPWDTTARCFGWYVVYSVKA